MMTRLKAYLRLGVHRASDKREADRIFLAHAIAVTLAVIAVPYIFIFWRMGTPYLGLGVCFVVFAYLITPLITLFWGFTPSRAFVLTIVNGFVFVYANFFGERSSLSLVFFGLAAWPFLIISAHEKGLLIYGAALSVAANLTLMLTGHELFGPPLVSPEVQQWLRPVMTVCAFVILLATVTHFALFTQRAQRLLDRRNEEMALVLSNVEQGLVTVGLDGHLSEERSAALERWFGPAPTGAPFWDYLGPFTESSAAWMQMAFIQVTEGFLPLEVALDQMPARLRHQSREYSLDFRPILRGDQLVKLLLVISDITDELARQRAEDEQRDFARSVRQLVSSRSAFIDFVDEANGLVAQVKDAPTSNEQLRRALHTLKGNAALFGLENFARCCHQAEDRLAQGEDAVSALRKVTEVWRETLGPLQPFLRTRSHVDVSFATLDSLASGIRNGEPAAVTLSRIEALKAEPLKSRFERLSEMARSLGTRLGKGEISVRIEDGGVSLMPETARSLDAVLVHLVRNAVDHGLEGPNERTKLGKAPQGQLELTAAAQNGGVEISVKDDGGGIPWERVKQKAMELGLPHSTEGELLDALFQSDMSTKEEVTDVSGRGVGLSAVRQTIKECGGDLKVRTVPKHGTTFTISVPAPHMSPAEGARGAAT